MSNELPTEDTVLPENAYTRFGAPESEDAPIEPRDLPILKFKVGDTVLIRAIQWAYIGTITEIGRDSVVLFPAVWVANIPRLSLFLKYGVSEKGDPHNQFECEPYLSPVELRNKYLAEVTAWAHPVPTEAK